jgi:serine phosphatase RsbU (regulator of sigma subunit)
MKLRTQLALAFLLLAVLPLGGIVLYSYNSSEEAFRQAVWAEANGMTSEMKTRLATARQQIKDRLTRLGNVESSSAATWEAALSRIGAADLPFVDSLEILPGGSAGLAEGRPVLVKLRTVPVPPAPPAAPTAPPVPLPLHELAARREESKRLVGDLSCPLRTQQGQVGMIQAHIKAQALIDNVFAVRREQGEMPFALDTAGRLYVSRPEDRQELSKLPLTCDQAAVSRMKRPLLPSWLIVTDTDPETGLCFGVARPIRKSLAAMRRAALRNFAYGLGLIGLCFAGIFPLTGRITRNLSSLMDGVERFGRGDLSARVPVRSRDELGRLGEAFNRMAGELSANQERLLEEERLRGELEQARRFQLSLLPRELPRRADLEIAVSVRTATEVGGDYYDFRQGDDDSLTLAIGDATGHGAAAATMVTVAKGLFTARGAELPPAEFLGHANEVIRRMQLGRMAMALSLLRIEGRRLIMASAGMPPLLIHRAQSGAVEEFCLPATPLGALAEPAYPDCATDLAPGDTLLLMTDGFPELLSPSGDPLGYPRASELFAAAAGKDPETVLADLAAAGESWSAGAPLHDDVTFVVVKVR